MYSIILFRERLRVSIPLHLVSKSESVEVDTFEAVAHFPNYNLNGEPLF